MSGSHYSDFSARNRRDMSTVHTTMISRRFLGEESAISRRDIAEKISGPTKRHVTSHVIDLDICEFLIMDARRWRRLIDCIATSLLLLVGSIECGQLIAIILCESWVLQKTTIVDKGLL